MWGIFILMRLGALYDPKQETPMIDVSIKEVKTHIEICWKAGLVPFIKGKPGVGKSSAISQLAEKHSLKMIDLRLSQCDPTDLLGFPYVDKETQRGMYAPMTTFPLTTDPIPDGFEGWVLNLDEFNSAERAVQKAAYKLTLDRMVGDHHLHDRVVLVCAGNREIDNAIVEELSTALSSRIIHFNVESDVEGWIEWAQGAGVDQRIISFIRFKNSALNNFNPNSNTGEPTFACERTWEFAAKLLRTGLDPADSSSVITLAGTLGEGVAREFSAFTQIYQDLPKWETILKTPETAEIPPGAGTQYALCGFIGQQTSKDTVGQVMPYIKRMPKEFQVICLRDTIKKDPSMISEPVMQQWVRENSTELF